jgi:hypothetical protein
MSEVEKNSEEESQGASASKDIVEVQGNAQNIAKIGSPVDHAGGGTHIRYYFYPTWRSQLLMTIAYLILSVIVVFICQNYSDMMVLPGKLFEYGDSVIRLYLPLPIIIPGFVLGKILLYIYNSKYIIDERGVEAQIGLVSLNLRQPRLRYEDIRGIEPQQTLWERILGIGSVLIGSAMTQDVEIIMRGVANPRAIQLLISGERDKRLKRMGGGRSGMSSSEAIEFVGD